MKKPPKPKSKLSRAQLTADRRNLRHARKAASRKLAKFGPSKAQSAAGRHAAAAGRLSQHKAAVRRRQGKPPLKKQLSPGEVSCCAAEALAASLRLLSVSVSGEDVLGLYWRVASCPDEGADVGELLKAAREHGLAGWFPSFRPVPASCIVTGTVLGYDSWWGIAPHAIAVDGGEAVSWGERYPLPDAPDEAWAITWRRS